MESTRLQKIERLLQKELSDIFQKQTQGMHGVLVSVSVVRVSPDLSVARAYLSIFPSDKSQELLEAIRSNTKAIRFDLGQRIRLHPAGRASAGWPPTCWATATSPRSSTIPNNRSPPSSGTWSSYPRKPRKRPGSSSGCRNYATWPRIRVPGSSSTPRPARCNTCGLRAENARRKPNTWFPTAGTT